MPEQQGSVSARAASTGDGPIAAQRIASLYHFLVESLTDYAVFAVSPTGDVLTWNAGAVRIFGYDAPEIVGRPFSCIFTPGDIAAGAPARELESALADRKHVKDRWHVRKDGSEFWGTNTVEPMYGPDHALLGFTKLVRDSTEAYLAAQALSDSEERLRLLIESVPEYAIFSTDLAGTITSWNAGAHSIFGYDQTEIVGTSVAPLIRLRDSSARSLSTRFAGSAQRTIHTERWLERKDGSRFRCSLRATQLKRSLNGKLRGFVILAHDVTQHYRTSQQLRHQALFDHLTQLPNRASFDEHVQRAIALVRRHPRSQFAVLFIDLDHFKRVNDTIGHVAADKVLELIARRLERCVRSEDIVARLSGDEFAVLLTGISGLADAKEAVARIHLELAKPIADDGPTLNVSASIGIAMGSPHYETPDQILRDADAAMYRAKNAGRARAIVFESTHDKRHETVPTVAAELRGAVERDEFKVVYQPIVQLGDSSVVGFEALVRWANPRLGLLLPTDFIAQAERSDVIVEIDRWVLTAACRQLKRWQHAQIGGGALKMSVNISSREFMHADFARVVAAIVRQSQIDPRTLRLEITETSDLEQSPQTAALIAAIRALGVELHADDFGTGYSSLSSLQYVPVSALKIDRSFVRTIGTPSGYELVRSIVMLAHNLAIEAIAEGIETLAERDALVRLGCTSGQGFLFSPPLNASDAERCLAPLRAPMPPNAPARRPAGGFA